MQDCFLNFNIELRKNVGFNHEGPDKIVSGQFDGSTDDFEFEFGIVEFFILVATSQAPVFKDMRGDFLIDKDSSQVFLHLFLDKEKIGIIDVIS